MSSSQLQKQALLPAGLPMSYVGSYAVVGIASLVYIGVMMSGSGAPDLTTAPVEIALVNETRIERELAVTDEHAADESSQADQQPDRPSTAPTQQLTAAEPPAGIETKYVTTQQILASRTGVEAAIPPLAPAQIAEPAPASSAAPPPGGTSSITTGSIAVPPPPERAPPRPGVTRTALKPALAPAIPQAPKKQAAKKQAAKAPAAPIEFGEAVVTETRIQPDRPPALAILLASGSSVESLRLTWNLLQERHSVALGNLQPRYILEKNPAAPERGFALIAGPVISATDVARVCSALVSEGLTCRTTTFGGNAL